MKIVKFMTIVAGAMLLFTACNLNTVPSGYRTTWRGQVTSPSSRSGNLTASLNSNWIFTGSFRTATPQGITVVSDIGGSINRNNRTAAVTGYFAENFAADPDEPKKTFQGTLSILEQRNNYHYVRARGTVVTTWQEQNYPVGGWYTVTGSETLDFWAESD